MSDLRFAARMLAKNARFTTLAVLLLAFGIGASTVIFTALEAILLRPLPVRHPEQLVRIVQDRPVLGVRSNFGEPYYRALTEHASTLSQIFGDAEVLVALDEPAPARQVRVHLVTPGFFQALGVPALHGRTLTPDDDKPDAGTPPAVLSWGFWKARFNGDARVIDQTIALRRHRFVVVGVMPRAFNGISIDTSPDVRVPLHVLPLLVPDPKNAWETTSLELAARLKPGITAGAARAQCQAIWNSTTEASRGWGTEPIELEPLEHGVSILRARFGPALKVLIASVALLQLMVCANLAGLLLARASRRREEMAVRLAVGATAGRLIRQTLTECALLTGLGMIAGALLAVAVTPLFVRALPPIRDLTTERVNLALPSGPDLRVLAFSLLVSAATALLFGAGPALAASRTSLDRVLRATRSGGSGRARQMLIMVQVALCMVLLAGAGLLVRTLRQLRDTDTGLDREHVVTFTVEASLAGYDDKQAAALRLTLLQRVRQLPGVVSAGTSLLGVMRGSGLKATVAPAGQRITTADFLDSSVAPVSADYFQTMGMRVLAGRTFSPADASARKPDRVVVNEAFVRRFFPNGDPIGRRFGIGRDEVAQPQHEIIGVVNDSKYRSLREPVPPTFYSQMSDSSYFVLYVRTRVRPEWLIEPVRRALAAIDPGLPFMEIHTLAEEVDASTAGERLTAILASTFGALAALLSAVGIYGLLAYTVAERQREIGVRIALGARAREVGRAVGGRLLAAVAIGVGIGLVLIVLTAPLAQALLYGVPPLDPVSLAGSAVLIAVVATAAAAVPLRRALRIEPAAALREQ